MTKVLVVNASPGPDPCVDLMIPIFKGIIEKTNCEIEFRDIQKTRFRHLVDTDILLSFRPISINEMKLATLARAMGIFTIMNIDDHLMLWNPPYYWKIIPKKYWDNYVEQRHNALKETARLSRVIMSPNKLLARIYADFGNARTAITRTIVSKSTINFVNVEKDKKETKKKIKIVYPANKDHAALFNDFIKPILPDLARKFPNQIELTIIGPAIDLPNDIPMQYRIIEFMPIEEYNTFMANENFDFGVAPIREDLFHACKYYNKYLDFAQHGFMGIFTNSEPYTLAVHDGWNGLLADNTKESWFNACVRAIQDSKLRKKCILNAQKDLLENYQKEPIIESLLDSIPEFYSYDAKKRNISKDSFRKEKSEFNRIQYLFKLIRVFYVITHFWHKSNTVDRNAMLKSDSE